MKLDQILVANKMICFTNNVQSNGVRNMSRERNEEVLARSTQVLIIIYLVNLGMKSKGSI